MTRRIQVYSRRPHLWRRGTHGPFYVVWTEGRTTRKRSTGTRRRAHAEAALDEFLKTHLEPAGERRTLTFRQAVDEWLADRERPRHGLAENTLRTYRSWAREFREAFPAKLLPGEVTPALLRRHLNKREDAGDSPTTLKKKLGGLSMVFEFLIREGQAARNPCKAIQLRAEAKRHPAMTEEEFATLHGVMQVELDEAKEADARRYSQELLDMADVLWQSGLRFIEATRLTWEDIDLDARTWVIRSPRNKGGVQALPIHPTLIPVLQRRKLLGGEGPFSGYWQVERLWHTFKDRHPEFKGWSWHRMRHAFVTRLRKAGREAAARILARHKSVAMSDHYTHLGTEDVRADLEAL